MTGETPIRGLVILQGLINEALPSSLELYLSGSHQHNLGGQIDVEVLELLVERNNFMNVMWNISKTLKSKRFYAHFIDGSDIYVVFPTCLAVVSEGDELSLHRAQVIGSTFEIPIKEMRFLELFRVDHPNEY